MLFALKPAFAVDPSTLLTSDQAFGMRVSQSASNGNSSAAILHFSIAQGYYLYKDRITAYELPAHTKLAIALPPGIVKDDPNFGRVEIYHNQVSGKFQVARATRVQISWQGCAEAGVCFAPQTRTVSIGGNVALPAASSSADALDSASDQASTQAPYLLLAPAPASTSTSTPDGSLNTLSAQQSSVPPTQAAPALHLKSLFSGFGASDESMRGFISGSSAFAVLLAFFALGVALAFTPCMLPMLPIVTTLIVGNRSGRARGFALSCAFVLAMALTYALLGILAARAGANLQIILQTPLINAAMCAVFVALAFSMFGFYQIQLPGSLRDALTRVTGNATGGTWMGAMLSGIVSALLVGPCMTAPLAGTLIYIADTGNIAWGGSLLFILGLGMGLPLLAISVVGAKFLPRPGAWMSRVNVALGFVLLATALFLGERTLPSTVTLAGSGLVLIALGWTCYGSTLPNAAMTPVRSRVLKRTIAISFGLYGASALIGAMAGSGSITCPLAVFSIARAATLAQPVTASDNVITVNSEAGLQRALKTAHRQGLPALVDFTADWCTSCKTVDRTVFSDPAVMAALAHVSVIRVDVTQSDAQSRQLMAMNQVIGPPTILLFGKDGVERRQQRIVGEFSVPDLLQRHPGQ